MENFADYQRKMWRWLSYITVCRFTIEKDKRGNYFIQKCGFIKIFMYYAIWVNSIIKIIYLILTYEGLLLEVHFLDQMSMWDWFLCFSQVVQESNMWYRKYPLYEILYQNWKIQEEVFRKLGSPQHVNDKIVKTCKGLVYLHFVIVFVGCLAIALQFLAAPKYALSTYAIVPYDTAILRAIFAVHEYIYIFHIWVHQASSIVICEVFSITYTGILNEMTEVMKNLSRNGETTKAIENGHFHRTASGGSSHSLDLDDEHSAISKRFIPDRMLNPKARAKGTEYDVMTLIMDYKKLMIASKEFNGWVGKLMGGTMGSNYGQFVSDVFMMIQLLKEPETDFMGVFFYFEDACAGMTILFRMLILISRVYPASEGFLEAYKNYVMQDTPLRKYMIKNKRGLRIIAMKLGGYSTNPGTVPKGVNCLFNYYIAAAMWQRPVDRRT